MTDELDPWLTSAEAAELAGMNVRTWRDLANKGYAPAPDDRGDQNVSPFRRTLRWRKSSVIKYMAGRRAHRGKSEPGDV